MKIGMFYPEVDFSRTDDIKIRQCGNNTGNNVFWYSLKRLLGIERIPYDYEKRNIDLNSFDAIITTDLIWIRMGDNFPFLEDLLEKTSIPIIPISVGLQANNYDMDFTLTSRTLSLLKRIEERAVIGVRGEFTAFILNKYGIKRFKIIGCPSMYYWNNPDLQITDNVTYPNNFLSNFKTFYGKLSQKEKHFLSYSATCNSIFVEQTALGFKPEHAADDKYYNYVNTWLDRNTRLFFSVDEWLKQTCLYDFSMGGRFHGNVLSLWNNIKALFMVTDSRTRELTSFFRLPVMEMNSFDRTRDLKFYYDYADYSEFNSIYRQRYMEFTGFLSENDISISESAEKISFAKRNEDKLNYIMQKLC